VPLELSPECPDKGDQDQRDNSSGQYCVGDQDREVERAKPTSTFKRDRADLVVLGEIRDQKKVEVANAGSMQTRCAVTCPPRINRYPMTRNNAQAALMPGR